MSFKRVLPLRAALSALLLLLLPFALPAADYGATLQNATGISYSSDAAAPGFSQFNRLQLWLDTPLGSAFSLYVSGFYDFSLAVNPDSLTPYRFDAGRIAFSGLMPGLFGESTIGSFSLGRIPQQDFAGRIVSGLNDGFTASLAFDNSQVKVGAGYLGLQAKNTALIMIDADDLNRLSGLDKAAETDPDFPSSYFALPRMFFNAGYRINEILNGHDMGFDLFGQLDLAAGTERTNTWYFEPYVAGRIGRLLRWNAWYILEMVQEASIDTAMAAGGRLRFTMPEFLSFNAALTVEWASGVVGEQMAEFSPVRQSMPGSYSPFLFANNTAIGLAAGLAILPGMFLETQGLFFMRGGASLPALSTINTAVAEVYMGTEASLGIRYTVTSDVQASLSGGVFVPYAAAHQAAAPLSMRAALVFVING